MNENKEYTVSQRMYNSLAPFYNRYARARMNYIQAINHIVRDHIDNDVHSVLDLGAGNGTRIHNILKGKSKQIKQVYLVENAPKMLENMLTIPKYHVIRQDFSSTEFNLQKKFDCITCLWNVMGHVEKNNVLTALNNMAKHLSPSGFVIIDINNRNNIKQYGIHAIKNCFRDLFFYNYATGDIVFDINITGNKIKSQVHLFSKTEFDRIIKQSNLRIQKCYYINYNTGKKEYFSFCGQLCYVLRGKV